MRSLTASPATILIRFLREEDPIAFASDLSKQAGRGAGWVRDKLEVLLFRRPAHRRCVFNEIADELILLVADLDAIDHPAPADAEGDVCRDGGAPMQGVHQVVEVPGVQVGKVHRSRCLLEVDLDALIGDAYRPKQATGGDTGVVVVELICDDKLVLKEIQSDEAEGACMLFPIHPNVDPLHETIVHVEEESPAAASTSVCSCPSPLDVCDAHDPIKIEDRRGLGSMDGRVDVKHLRPWTKNLGAAGNRSRSDLRALVGIHNGWEPES